MSPQTVTPEQRTAVSYVARCAFDQHKAWAKENLRVMGRVGRPFLEGMRDAVIAYHLAWSDAKKKISHPLRNARRITTV